MADALWATKPEHWEEIKGMAEAIGCGERFLLIMQYIYELSAFCTSTVAYDSSGMIHHARNLDFLFAEDMRNITYEAHFKKNKKLLFKAVLFGG